MESIHNANSERRLWLSPEEFSNLTSNSTFDGNTSNAGRKNTTDSYDTIFQQFSSKPPPKSLALLLSNTLALLQEFVLTSFLLAGHRAARVEELEYDRRRLVGIPTDGGIQSGRLFTSLGLVWFTLLITVVHNNFANSKRLFLHLVACDYDYANGLNGDVDDDGSDSPDSRKKTIDRPTFKGGMMSLTSAFFATTLLASRLESNAAVFVFVSSSVILFALYPANRHLVAVKATRIGKLVPLFVSGILTFALILLLEPGETLIVLAITMFVGIFVPLWKYYLQHHKIWLRGPWDIAHI